MPRRQSIPPQPESQITSISTANCSLRMSGRPSCLQACTLAAPLRSHKTARSGRGETTDTAGSVPQSGEALKRSSAISRTPCLPGPIRSTSRDGSAGAGLSSLLSRCFRVQHRGPCPTHHGRPHVSVAHRLRIALPSMIRLLSGR